MFQVKRYIEHQKHYIAQQKNKLVLHFLLFLFKLLQDLVIKSFRKDTAKYTTEWNGQAVPSYVGVGARLFAGKFTPPPLRDKEGPLSELALLTRFESRNTTMTEISSWKCLLTPRSIFFRSEYLISLFFAASCSAAFTSRRALPWRLEFRKCNYFPNKCNIEIHQHSDEPQPYSCQEHTEEHTRKGIWQGTMNSEVLISICHYS